MSSSLRYSVHLHNAAKEDINRLPDKLLDAVFAQLWSLEYPDDCEYHKRTPRPPYAPVGSLFSFRVTSGTELYVFDVRFTRDDKKRMIGISRIHWTNVHPRSEES